VGIDFTYHSAMKSTVNPLFQLLTSRWSANANKLAIETPNGTQLTYTQLDLAVARHAGLIRDLGVQPGEPIAVQLEKSPDALILYLACVKVGVVYLPLNSAYQESEVDYFLGDAKPAVFVHQPKSTEWAMRVCERHHVRHRFEMGSEDETAKPNIPRASWAENASNAPPLLDFVPRALDDLAAILYTSGTTGRSKGAMLTQRNLASNAETLHRYWGFQPDDVLLHALPLFHVHGLFVACHTALINASTMLFHAKFDAARAVVDLRRATVFMGVPTMYVRLLAEPNFDAALFKHMRLFVSGSAPLLTETFSEFKSRTGHTILERYGMTETGMITSNPLNGERVGGTVGLPLPDVIVRVVDDQGDVCACDDIGHIQVKGPNVLPGYWQMPEKNKEEFTADGFFKTGDVGKIDAKGYVTIVGRSKDLVITGGYNVYPKEIELLLEELPGVLESAVIGLPHPDFGEAVTAVVVPKPGAMLDEAAIIAAMKAKLAAFKVPKRVFVVNELPRNAMGKVQKGELRKGFADIFAGRAT
jgi:malonyl-CoA/methylmalonyl-CoA synthetase